MSLPESHESDGDLGRRPIERAGWFTDHPLRDQRVHVVTREWFDELRAQNSELREAARKVLSAHMAGLDMVPSLNRLEDAAGFHDMGGT